jgi:hypothetical protein
MGTVAGYRIVERNGRGAVVPLGEVHVELPVTPPAERISRATEDALLGRGGDRLASFGRAFAWVAAVVIVAMVVVAVVLEAR